MTTIGAHLRKTHHRGFPGGQRHPWVAIVDGFEISGASFSTREDAVAFAMRVAAYQKESTDVETVREGQDGRRRRPGALRKRKR